ncbi:unnamed protein product, partial [Amoebophrya sp. A120]|eukprot:GSA120T00007029001.1
MKNLAWETVAALGICIRILSHLVLDPTRFRPELLQLYVLYKNNGNLNLLVTPWQKLSGKCLTLRKQFLKKKEALVAQGQPLPTFADEVAYAIGRMDGLTEQQYKTGCYTAENKFFEPNSGALRVLKSCVKKDDLEIFTLCHTT